MKWGVRKAERYATDTHQHMYNKEVAKSKQAYNTGKITKAQHKQNKVNARLKRGSRNDYVRNQLRKTPLTKKGVSAKTISDSYKSQAYKSIPKYGLKRGLRGAWTGWSGYALAAHLASIPVAVAMGAPSVVIGGSILGTAIDAIISEDIGTWVSRRTM